MPVAKVVRSGATVSIQFPPGFEIGEGDVEVVREGTSVLLRPIDATRATQDDWSWLDGMEPASQAFTDEMTRIEAEDIAAASKLPAPRVG